MWKLTDSEWKVLEALWAGGPQHLGQILGALAPETGWSRTTVHTYLTRSTRSRRSRAAHVSRLGIAAYRRGEDWSMDTSPLAAIRVR